MKINPYRLSIPDVINRKNKFGLLAEQIFYEPETNIITSHARLYPPKQNAKLGRSSDISFEPDGRKIIIIKKFNENYYSGQIQMSTKNRFYKNKILISKKTTNIINLNKPEEYKKVVYSYYHNDGKTIAKVSCHKLFACMIDGKKSYNNPIITEVLFDEFGKMLSKVRL